MADLLEVEALVGNVYAQLSYLSSQIDRFEEVTGKYDGTNVADAVNTLLEVENEKLTQISTGISRSFEDYLTSKIADINLVSAGERRALAKENMFKYLAIGFFSGIFFCFVFIMLLTLSGYRG